MHEISLGSGTHANQTRQAKLIMVLSIVLIAICSTLRFVNLAHAEYWANESNTSQVLTGYQADDVRSLMTDKVVSFGEIFDRYQSTKDKRSVKDAMKVIEISLIPHTPLYYLGIYYWSRMFDAQRGTLRLFAAILGMLQLPAVLWFAFELFGEWATATFATAIFFLSPFQLWYCQENAEYSLLAAVAAACSAALLRATRKTSVGNWFLYSTLLCLALYSSLNILALLIAHFIFMCLHDRPKKEKDLLVLPRNFSLFIASSLLAILATAPFLYVLLMNASVLTDTMAWTSVALNLKELAVGWLDDLVAPICYTGDFQFTLRAKALIALIPVFAYYFLCRKTDKRTRDILLLTAVVPFALFVIPDLIVGGQRSIVTRYLMVSAVSASMIIANLFIHFSQKKKLQTATGVAFAALVAFEFFCFNSVLTAHSHFLPDHTQTLMAKVLNEHKGSLVLSEEVTSRMNVFQFLCLSHIVEPTARLLWLDHPDVLELPKGTKNFYVYNPPPTLMYTLESYGYKLSPVDGDWAFLKAEPQQ